MRGRFLLVLICGFILTACGGNPASIPPSPTEIPSATPVPTAIAEVKLEAQTGTAYTLDWSPDGKILAADSAVEITLLSADLSETFVVLKPEGGALSFAWSPDQKQFASVLGLRNPRITLWDWNSDGYQLTKAQQISAGSDLYGVAWSPDGKMLATLANDRKSVFQIWDTSTWEQIHKYELPYANPRRALNWSEDSLTLYDAGELDGQAVIFAMNVLDGTIQELGRFPVEQVDVFTISPDTKRFAIASPGKLRILNAETGAVLQEFLSVSQPVDLAWNPNGGTLAILDYKTTLQLWDVSQK